MREVFTAFALLLVFGIALLMSSVGVSMALGAFLAGVLLASSEYRHALESDIAPFRGLLMGLFFIAVGMSIDFGLLAERPLAVLPPWWLTSRSRCSACGRSVERSAWRRRSAGSWEAFWRRAASLLSSSSVWPAAPSSYRVMARRCSR